MLMMIRIREGAHCPNPRVCDMMHYFLENTIFRRSDEHKDCLFIHPRTILDKHFS